MGEGLILAPNRTQEGGLIGSMLASINILPLMGALSGKGLQVDPPRVAQPPSPYYGDILWWI